MRKHLASLGIGSAVGIIGLVLLLTTQGIETPIVTLSKVGVVLAILGAIEVLVSGIALALPSTRHRSYEL